MTSPQGHQFDHSVKTQLVFVLLIIPVNLICHMTMLKNNFWPQGTPEPQAPLLVSERERSGRVLDSRLRGRGFEPHQRHCVVVPENHKNKGFYSITGLDLLKITKPAFDVGHYQPASETPFQWRFAGRPIIACSWWFLEPRSPRKNKIKKTYQSWTPSDKTTHDVSYLVFGRIHTKFGIKNLWNWLCYGFFFIFDLLTPT